MRQAAHADDSGVRDEIRQTVAVAKVAVPKLCGDVIDMALQVHGASGVSQDTILAQAYASARALRIADGSDEVHATTIAKLELRKK